MCSEGTLGVTRIEDVDGRVLSEEEIGSLWDEAMESGEVLNMTLHDEFTCSDGSGSLLILVHNVVQPSALDFEGANDVGTWEIDGGTGDGTFISDFGQGEFHYSGEIQES